MKFLNPFFYITLSPILLIILIMLYKIWGFDAENINLTISEIKYWESLRAFGYFVAFFYFSYRVTELFIIGTVENLKEKFIELFILLFVYIILINYTLSISIWIKEVFNIFLN